MPNNKMTDGQQRILWLLDKGPQSVRGLCDQDKTATDDMVRSSLRRMEDRGWVRRVEGGDSAKWELTGRGRKEAGL